MSSHSKQKKVKGVKQKLKLFRANEPIKSVLMWGVNYSLSQLEHIKTRVMLLNDDFKAYIKVKVDNHFFNKENMISRFKFKEYCPMVFQELRRRFSIDTLDYWDSFTKKQPEWLDVKGKSGSRFMITSNSHFVIKTISQEEVEQMHHMLNPYYEYIVKCFAETRLPQYLGMYRLTIADQETYMLVMRNVFNPQMPLHRKYDLKGSTVDREASEKEKKSALPTLKDVDLLNDSVKIDIGTDVRNSLITVLERDVEFLQANNLMDYSLIVGIHDCKNKSSNTNDMFTPLENKNVDDADGYEDELQHMNDLTVTASSKGVSGGCNRNNNDEGVELMTSFSIVQQGTASCDAFNKKGANRTYSTEVSGEEDCMLVLSENENNAADQSSDPESPKEVSFSYGVNLKYQYDLYAVPSSNDSIIYFMSLIDILTRYDMRKRTAQKYKAVKHGSHADISTVKPEAYAKRFIEFIKQIIV